jgi:hypothetical protein
MPHYILPLIFLKRLADVFEDEITGLQDEYGNMKVAEDIAQQRANEKSQRGQEPTGSDLFIANNYML